MTEGETSLWQDFERRKGELSTIALAMQWYKRNLQLVIEMYRWHDGT
jgi:hypothetical protein